MFALHQQIKNDVQVLHVNGHVGVEGNELADRMSIVAIDKKEPSFEQYEGYADCRSVSAPVLGELILDGKSDREYSNSV